MRKLLRCIAVGSLVGAVLTLTLSSIANSLLTVSVSDATATEAEGVMTFTITLSEPSASVVHVGYFTQDGTAVAPGDYTSVSDGQDIPLGQTSATFDVPIIDDGLPEADETLNVFLVNVATAEVEDGLGVGTILDDEPTVSVSDQTRYENCGAMIFTVTLSRATSYPIHIGFGTIDGTATSPEDYAHTLTGHDIPAGSTTTTFQVAIIDDALLEGDETFTVSLVNVAKATVVDGTGIGTIVDTERTVSIFDMPANEEDGTSALPILLSSPSALPVLVWTSATNGTATSPDDYDPWLEPVIIPAGEPGVILQIPIVDDAKFEGTEYFKVQINTFPEVSVLNSAKCVVMDDDGSVSIADETANEDAGTMTFTATLSDPAPTPIHVTFITTDGTAHAPADYTDTFHEALFLIGTTTATFDVPIVDDVIGEKDERFTVSIMNVFGATTIEGVVSPFSVDIADGQAIGTIVDNEASVSISDATASEGSDAMAFTVTLSRMNATPVEVTLRTSSGTAIAPGDYTHTHQDLEIQAGRTTATFRVPIVDDVETEPSETFEVHIDAVVGAVVNDGVGIGTITDNEPTVSVGDATAEEGAGTMAFAVSLSHETTLTVHVALMTEDGTAVAPGDFSQMSGDVEIAPGNTSAIFRVPIIDDGLDEPDETFEVQIGSVVGADVADGEATGTITDNDGAEIDVQRPVDASIPDGGADDVGSVPVGPVDLTYTVDNTAGSGPVDVPFVAMSNRLNLHSVTVVTPLPLHVEAGGTASLEVSLDVAAEGAFGVDLAIANNDLDENPYDLVLRGRALRVGDVNGDGIIDLLDVRICHGIAAGTRTPTEVQAEQADVDVDGDVDMDDACLLAEIVLGTD